MRQLLVALILTLLAPATVQAQVLTPSIIIPSPAGIAVSVGKWIYDMATREKVYYIEVIGEGRTVDEARNTAFRVAVESAIGSIMSSESEVQNGRLARDEIISYASGHVDKYEVLSQQPSPIGVKITMKVWVRRSTLSNRLLNVSEKSGEVDGARASVQLKTINQERTTGDQLVATVLRDFPKRAFDIDLKVTELKYGNRQGMLEVPFVVTWNKDYLSSLWAALSATAQNKSNYQSKISVGAGLFGGVSGGTAAFDDSVKYNQIVSTFINSGPSLLITIKSTSNSVLYRQCYNWSELDHVDDYTVRSGRFVVLSQSERWAAINGGFKLKGTALVPANSELLASAARVDADIVPKSSCPNQ